MTPTEARTTLHQPLHGRDGHACQSVNYLRMTECYWFFLRFGAGAFKPPRVVSVLSVTRIWLARTFAS